jgi:hypothetical protein
VLDGLLPLAPVLVDLGQPEVRGAGVEQIVDENPVPGERLRLSPELIQELGPGELFVDVLVEGRVPGLVQGRLRGPEARPLQRRQRVLRRPDSQATSARINSPRSAAKIPTAVELSARPSSAA